MYGCLELCYGEHIVCMTGCSELCYGEHIVCMTGCSGLYFQLVIIRQSFSF